MIGKLYERILADSESESEASGYLSWRGEWHAALWGFGAVFLAFSLAQPALLSGALGWVLTAKNARDVPAYIPYPRQFLKESAYLLGHGLAGAVVGIMSQPYLAGVSGVLPI